MNSNNEQRMNIHDQNAYAVDSRALQYGVADAFPVGRPFGGHTIASPSVLKKLKFFVGEVTGLSFIVLSTLYILAMPASLTRPGELKSLVNRTMKRTLDIIGASIGLVLALPIIMAVAIAVKLDSRGPIFYTQVRVGVNRRKRDRRYCQQVGVSDQRDRDRRRVDYLGRPFQMIKFRTMVQDAEKATGPVWATQNDPRITRLGAFLRKTRLDEIPQFWSILIGDMSLVGPRPERPTFVRELCTKVKDYHRRLDVKPGLTGLAQVENGYDSSIASVNRKVKFDLHYIKSWSLWYDIRILMKTVVVVVTGKGAC
jgi:lipopolysaccharide/colanic/teichoic acid biosynthesis glycosyltransferase